MKKLKRFFTILLTIIMLLTGWGVWWLFKAAFPDDYFVWYPLVPTFYYVMGLVLIAIITRDKRESQIKLVNLYMILKLCKIAACMALGAFFMFIVKEKLREFSIVFVSFYLLYLGIETYFFYRVEEAIKLKKTDE